MSKVFALDWDPRQLRLVAGRRTANQIRVDRVAVIPIGSDGTTSESAPSGSYQERLSRILSDPSYRNADILVSARRSDVELRVMRIPKVPVEELPDIVRMQAINEFSEASEDWPIDYLPLTSTDEETTVLAAVISPRRVGEYQKILGNAELRPKCLVLRPTATGMLMSRLLDASRPDVELCVEDLGGELELSVLRDGKPILIRTVQAPRSDTYDRIAFLGQEVKRTALAARNQLGGHDVDRLVIFGDVETQASQVADQLETRLDLPVVVLDPFRDVHVDSNAGLDRVDQRGQFAAAVGLLVCDTVDEPAVIDFLHPRRYEPSRSPQRMALLGAIALVLLLLSGFGAFYWKLHSLDQEARQLQARIQNQRTAVTQAEQRIAEVASIDSWQQGDIDWLSQMKEISTSLPGPESARFMRWQATVLSDGNGQIIVEGVADQQQTIGEVDRALRSDQRRVRTFGGDFEDRVAGYPWRFKQTVTVQTAPDSPTDSVRRRRSTVLPR